MSEPTIGVAIIVKDGKKTLGRLLPQLARLNQVVILDTGSTDGTQVYVKRKFGKRPFELHEYEWRSEPKDPETGEWYDPHEWGFAGARNESFRLLTTDYGFWIDADDVIGNARDQILSARVVEAVFRNIVRKAPDLDQWFLDYIYSRDDYLNPNCIILRERLIKNPRDYKWCFPIHEVLFPPKPPQYAQIDDVKILHLPDRGAETSSDRNLRYLNKWLEQLHETGDPDSMDYARCRMQIADALYSLDKFKEAADAFLLFIKNSAGAQELEIWRAWTWLGKCQMELQNLEAATFAYLNAIKCQPNLADGYYGLAQVKLVQEAPPEDILRLVDAGERCPETPKFAMQNPLEYTFVPYLIACDALLRKGDCDLALKLANKALALRPNDRKAQSYRVQAAEAVRARDGREAALALFQILKDFEENEKASELWNYLPYLVQSDDTVQDSALEARKVVRHLRDKEAYKKLYNEQALHAVPEEIIEKGGIPSIERFAYVLGRLRKDPKIKRVVEIGCADGFHSIALARLGYEVVGIDIDERSIALARERAEKYGLADKLRFMCGMFEDMVAEDAVDPFDESQPFFHHFDAVFACEVLEHVQDPAFFLECMAVCVKDGAPIIVSTPDGAFDGGDIPEGAGHHDKELNLVGHVRAFTQSSLEAALRSNVEYHVTECHHLDFPEALFKGQGWLVGEIRRMPHPDGPVIRVHCGSAPEPFSPDSLSEGVGGSETAVILMAKYWFEMGCRVVVYSDAVGTWDGVIYQMTDQWSPKHHSDVFIAWRSMTPFQTERPDAYRTVLWVHDINLPYGVDEKWASRVDKVAVLSKSHRKHFLKTHPEFCEEQMWVTRNGIEPNRFASIPEKKEGHHYFYTSSPDRGLETLLAWWPEVRKEIPDATLHIAYGWHLAFKFTRGAAHEAIQRLHRLANHTEGVIDYGKINQQELAKVQAKCKAWLYPPHPFEETYCITALEAQAVKAVPITRRNGALPETIKSGIEWKDDWRVADLIEQLKKADDISPEFEELVLDENRKWALSKSWASLARQWVRELAPEPELAEAK